MTPERTAVDLLDDFARRTGLLEEGSPGSSPEAPAASGRGPDPGAPRPRRYLWTDAHAVCTWLGLHADRGEDRFLELALRLVDEVHRVLGRHREDDARSGWLSGLGEEEGARHPTAGGLRIGKPRPERPAGAPADRRAEWGRDGQYFHYLTRWMHALRRVAEHTGEVRYHRWAVELAKAAFGGFVVEDRPGGVPRMVWKTSVDLSRVTVESMGHHDPLDGFVTFADLQVASAPIPDLGDEVATFARMCARRGWVTADPLGAGGLLIDAWRWGRLVAGGDAPGRVEWDGAGPASFLAHLAAEARASLEAAARETSPAAPFERRLAFREMGLSLGVHAAERLVRLLEGEPELAAEGELATHVEGMLARAPLATALERSWLDPASRRATTWRDHEDINAVSLATSLAPGGWLG